jgi:hypothetical protein
MPRFSTQKQIKISTYDMGAHFPSNFIFHFEIHIWYMSLRQKGTYAPPQDQAWGLNIHDGK